MPPLVYERKPHQRKLLGSFDGTAYGDEYLTVAKGDLVLLCAPKMEYVGSGWSEVISVEKKVHGWVPSSFLASM